MLNVTSRLKKAHHDRLEVQASSELLKVRDLETGRGSFRRENLSSPLL